MKSPITTHVLDTSLGKPASGVFVHLHYLKVLDWKALGRGTTNADGRVTDLLPQNHVLEKGTYRLTFETKGFSAFFPEVEITFLVENPAEHYHVPLLLSGHGYSTYRGS